MSKNITISSSDGTEISLAYDFASQSKTILAMMGDPENEDDLSDEIYDNVIPLTAIETDVLQFIIKYIENSASKDKIWKMKFINDNFKDNDELLYKVIVGSNYLDIPELLDLCCEKVAQYIKECSSTKEIRQKFNIENDFTPEEEAKIKTDNPWLSYN